MFDVLKSLRMIALAPALVIGLGACTADLSGLLSGPPPAVYQLDAPKAINAEGVEALAEQLSIEEPLTALSLDTERIAVNVGDQEVQYLAASRWEDRAPRLLQQMLVEGFENAGLFSGVARKAVGLRADYVLYGELRTFAVDVDNSSKPAANIAFTLNLVWPGNARIVASKTFEASSTAKSTSAKDLVAAMNVAQQDALKQAILWTVQKVGADVALRRPLVQTGN